MRVLYAWELGDNYGHLTRGVALGQSLRQGRHPVMFAVRNTTIANEILVPAGFHFVQAPVHMRSRPFHQPISNYAGILLASGYDDLPGLSGMLRAWMSQILLFGADVVLIDHAPTALLAARALGIPAIAVGTGFEIPPDVMPFPSFAVTDSEQGSGGLSDGEALRNINRCLRDIGKPELADMGGLFAYSTNLITTIEELDHYPTRTNALHVGPITGARNLARVEWQTDKKIKALVYLRGQRSLLGERPVNSFSRG
ncbi:glycosyltransferase family 1 protein [Rhizobium leguminosarum]|uniref:hypothetical protein n=1 Tax=Rhizobium leguminosarum TaxID=384 RepID=UPI0021BC103E|nr:hypothetical protein [Rhizobium leguminosarum]MBY5766626.1 glycosyltransferase family 1 protein [Rhizobium leguminosarum]